MLAFANEATSRQVTELLGRTEGSSTRQYLSALRREGLATWRASPQRGQGQWDTKLWRLTMSGRFASAQQQAAGVAQAQLLEDAQAILHRPQRPRAGAGVAPVRVAPVRVSLAVLTASGTGAVNPARRAIGAQLASLRRNAGWRQADLAQAARLSVRGVRELEGGLNRQDVLGLLACCFALGARLADIVVVEP